MGHKESNQRNKQKEFIGVCNDLFREAIQYDVMEECLVSAVVKHLGLQETVRYFTPSKEQQTDDFMLLSSVMEEVCRRFDALIRQLQVKLDLSVRETGNMLNMFTVSLTVPSKLMVLASLSKQERLSTNLMQSDAVFMCISVNHIMVALVYRKFSSFTSIVLYNWNGLHEPVLQKCSS